MKTWHYQWIWYKTKVGSQNFGYQLWFCTRLIMFSFDGYHAASHTELHYTRYWVHLHNFANNCHGIQMFMKYRLFHCMAIWNGVFPCVAYGHWLEHEPSWLWLIFYLWVIKLAWGVWGISIDIKLAWTVWKYIYRHKPHLDCITNPNL